MLTLVHIMYVKLCVLIGCSPSLSSVLQLFTDPLRQKNCFRQRPVHFAIHRVHPGIGRLVMRVSVGQFFIQMHRKSVHTRGSVFLHSDLCATVSSTKNLTADTADVLRTYQSVR